MFNLGDVFLRLMLGDTSQFRQQVQREAEGTGGKAGQTLGQRLSQNLKTGFGALAGGLIVGATEQAAKFEDQLRTINTVAKLSDEELSGVGDGIKDLSRETGKSLDDLTGGFYDLVSAGVPTDKALAVLKSSAILATGALGTTNEAVDLVTSALGAYGLGAESAGRVTDIFAQAVADGKTTVADLAGGISTIAPIAAAAGVSLEEVAAQTALMTLKGDTASQAMTRIRAAISALLTPNATLAQLSKETGINFAELAKEKGLGVALDELRKATKGNNEEFAKALGSSEALTLGFAVTGENAEALALELAKIEGGADKGGVALEQYNEKSRSAVEQGKRLIANIQSFLVTVGGPFVSTLGPAIFAVNELGRAFGLQGIAAKAFGGIIGALSTRLIGPLKDGIVRAFVAAEVGTRLETIGIRMQTLWIKGMTKFDAFSNAISSLWGRIVGSAPVQGAIAAAGAVAGRVYALAAAASATLAGAITGAWSAISGSVAAAAAGSGTLAGTAFAAAAAAAIIAAPLIVLKVALDIQGEVNAQGEDIKAKTAEFIRVASDTDLANSIEGVKKELDKIPGNAFDARNKTIDVLNMLIAEQNARLSQSEQAAHAAGLATGEGFGEGLEQGAEEAVPYFAGKVKDDLAGAGFAREAHRQGLLAGAAVARGITEKREAVDDAWTQLLEAIRKPISETKETAKLLGRLASTKLIEGMNSADPAVRAQARATKQLILDRLAELEPSAGTLSKAAMESLRRGMKSKDPDIRAASTAIYNAAINGPKGLTVEKGKTWGANIGKGIAAGLNAQARAVGAAAGNLAGIIADYFKTGSPAKRGPLSEGNGPGDYGLRIGQLVATGLASAVDLMRQAAHTLAGAAVPAYALPSGGMMDMRAPQSVLARPGISYRDAASVGARNTTINVQVEGQLPVRSPLDLARTLKRFADSGVFEPDAPK